MTILERWFEEVWNQGQEAKIEEMLAPAVKGHGLITPDDPDYLALTTGIHRVID